MLSEIYVTSLYYFPYRRGTSKSKNVNDWPSGEKEAMCFLKQHQEDVKTLRKIQEEEKKKEQQT
jgi:hypothetical protein